MDTQLDSESASPLYQQVFEVIKGKIETGRYPAHSQIPTESELSRMYSVGRITVRRAIEELVNEGYLTKRQGRGTFVTAPKMVRKVHQKDDVQSFTDACNENGMRAGAHLISCSPAKADDVLASFFNIAPGSDLILVNRLRTADGIPVLLENNYYPSHGFEFLYEEDLTDRSIFQVVGGRTGHYPVESEPCRLEIARADIEVARILDVPVGEPLFYMNVGFLDAAGISFCYGRQFYVGSDTVFISNFELVRRVGRNRERPALPRIAACGPCHTEYRTY